MPVALSVDRIQGLSGSLAIKIPVVCATTAAISLSGLQTIDGVALAEGDRVLVKDQTDLTTNGLYTATTSAWQRTLDFNRANDAIQGTLVHVVDGAENPGLWQLTTADPIIGTSNLEFTEFATGTSTGGGGSGSTTNYYSTFTGDGVTQTFCLPTAPGSIANTMVVVDGTILVPTTDYTLTDNCFTTVVAPGESVVVYVAYSTTSASSVSLLTYRYTVTGSEVANAISLPYAYVPGSNTLAVFHRGVYEDTPAYFAETDGQTVTFTYDLVTGDEYVFIIGQIVNNGDTLVVQDGTITANKLAANAVTTVKVLDGNITLAKLADIATTKFLGRRTAGTGVPEAVTINDFDALASLDSAADYLLLWDASASLHKKVLLGNVVGSGTLGVNQTWQDLTSSRAKNTTYQNTTGKPIQVVVDCDGTGATGATFQVSTDGSAWVSVNHLSGADDDGAAQVVVPHSHYYRVSTVDSGISIGRWAELR